MCCVFSWCLRRFERNYQTFSSCHCFFWTSFCQFCHRSYIKAGPTHELPRTQTHPTVQNQRRTCRSFTKSELLRLLSHQDLPDPKAPDSTAPSPGQRRLRPGAPEHPHPAHGGLKCPRVGGILASDRGTSEIGRWRNTGWRNTSVALPCCCFKISIQGG